MFVSVTSLLLATIVFNANAKMLQGSIRQCRREGESVIIAGITTDPCIHCFCRSGVVECDYHKCDSMDGCHAVLFERPEDSCCDVCKGCHHNGSSYPSGATWTDISNPCWLFQCQAGVVTRSVEKCHVDCDRPVYKQGECCPSCSDCFFEGVDRLDGETFRHSSSPGVLCTCKAGQVTCSYRACPVLNCPDGAQYQPAEERCPHCKGQRTIFNLPTSCYFAKRVFSQGNVIRPDSCTICSCWAGTVYCERETCWPPLCDVTDYVFDDTSCCPKCREQPSCYYDNQTYQKGNHWLDPVTCQQCRCEDGVTSCIPQICPESVVCPQGHSLHYQGRVCCPHCVKDDAVCTVTSNAYHQTFDGHVFHAHGTCRYQLSRDCQHQSFFVKVRNSPRVREASWTEVVTVGVANFTIHLYRSGRARVNYRPVSLPYRVPSHFTLQRIGNQVIVNAYQQRGLKVIWDGHNRLEVVVSKIHKNNLCGLCGNHNGDPTDDLRDKVGDHVSGVKDFLLAWRVRGRCQRTRGPRVSSDLITACRPGSAGAIQAQEYCGGFFHDEFRACSSRINILPYISQCLYDTCTCSKVGTCHLQSLRSLARRCKRADFNVRWWRVTR